jgi:hypothetical protein
LRATSAKVFGRLLHFGQQLLGLGLGLFAIGRRRMLAGAVIRMWLARRSSFVPKRALFCS